MQIATLNVSHCSLDEMFSVYVKIKSNIVAAVYSQAHSAQEIMNLMNEMVNNYR